MKRLTVGIATSLALAGCSSFSPGDWLSPGGGGGYPVKLESDPPGAEARTSLGPGCRTPCTVAVPARDDFTVTFALAGYEMQTVPVSLQRSAGFGSEFTGAVQFAPNPVSVQLQPAPPPQVAKKKTKAKPRTAAKAAPASDRAGPSPSEAPAAHRTIPGAQPTAPPASAWPPPR